MPNISISEEFRAICPTFKGAAIIANISNSPTSKELWQEITDECRQLKSVYTTESIKERSGIAATRTAYRKAGKDPSRYRPACEQLARRALQGKDLYSIDTIVDIGNLVSLSTGYATAMLDLEKIEGEEIILRLGKSDDIYEGIGRGLLNIESLPVYCDTATGIATGIATPTSDSVKTKISSETHHLLMLINAYDGDNENLHFSINKAIDLLKQYADAQNVEQFIYE